MKNRAKTSLSLALAIVGGIAAGTRCDASVKVESSSHFTPRVAAYTVTLWGQTPWSLHFTLSVQYLASGAVRNLVCLC